LLKQPNGLFAEQPRGQGPAISALNREVPVGQFVEQLHVDGVERGAENLLTIRLLQFPGEFRD
jgi:hypothetical protein